MIQLHILTCVGVLFWTYMTWSLRNLSMFMLVTSSKFYERNKERINRLSGLISKEAKVQKCLQKLQYLTHTIVALVQRNVLVAPVIGKSIGCKKWYHYPCVSLTGDEPWLKRKRSKWFCKNCEKGKGKGEVTNQRSDS